MRRLFTLLLLIACFGCVPHADYPLGSIDDAPNDTFLLGTWFWNEEADSGYIHIGRVPKSPLLNLVMVTRYRDGSMTVSEFNGHLSTLGDDTYLNLKWLRPPQTPVTGYLLVKVTAGPQSLKIGLLNGQAMEDAVNSGLLEGAVDGDGWGSTVRITASPEKLRAFFIGRGKELFPDSAQLSRLSLPAKAG